MPSITAREAARLKALGFRPIPIPAKEKGPRILDWPNWECDLATVDRDFPTGSNIGLIMGRGLLCVDIDHQSALDLAEGILPPTSCIIGRPGRPRSHWFYRVEGEIKTTRFKVIILTDQSEEPLTVIDLLANGSQVVTGPSVHPSGDIYDDIVGEPATVDYGTLLEAVTNLFNQAKDALRGNGVEIVEDTKPTKKPASKVGGAPLRAGLAGEAPGTAYNREHPGPLLIRHGWTLVSGGGGGKENWRRPGKEEGTSATLTPHNGGWQFYCFSSSANLPPNENFSPHGLLAHLEHGGDFVAAARALRLAGFGDDAKTARESQSGPKPGESREPAAPKVLPWKPFPVELLPDLEREYCESVALSTKTDVAWCAAPCLSVMGAAIGMARAIEVKPGWREVPSLWLAMIGESGCMKSPLLKKVTRPFWAICKRLAKEFAKAMWAFLAAKERFEDEQDIGRKSAKAAFKEQQRAKQGDVETATETPERQNLAAFDADAAEPPAKPPERRNLVVNSTVQKLKSILSENPKGLLVFFDELKGWFSGMVRHAKTGADEFADWLPMDSGEPILDDTLSRGTTFVKAAFAVVLGGIQPGVLRKLLTDDFKDCGGAARFSFVMPPKVAKVWTNHGVPREVDDRWDRHIEGLFNLCMGGTDDDPVPSVIELPLEGPAKQTWLDWWEPHSKRIDAAEGGWASFLAKMEGKAARIALIVCVSDRVQRGHGGDLSPIEGRWVEAGCQIADWFIYERERTEGLLASTTPVKPIAFVPLMDKVSIALRTAGAAGMTKTQLYELAGKATKKTVLDAVLLYLIGKGLVRKETVPPNGGPPTELYLAV